MSNNMRKREFDIVIFGATGFTGQYSIRALVQSMAEKENASIRWAVAARNLHKLEQTLKRIVKELNQNDYNDIFANVGRIRADVRDTDSIDSMVRRTTVLVNTVGPYADYGPPVVATCVRHQTHHLDLSGESFYVEDTVLRHDLVARENNTIIIPSCGFDCVPTDMGVHYLKRAFDGILTTAETYGTYKPSPEGYPVNKGTFDSAILFFRDLLPTIRTRMKLANKGESVAKSQSNEASTDQLKLPLRILPFKRPEFDGINILMPSEDKPLILRTQRYMLENYGEPPVQVQTYFTLQTIIGLIQLLFFVMVLMPLMLFGAGRRFLSRNIDQVTLGYFSRNGPNERQIAGTSFKYRIVGQGWATGKPIDDNRSPNETMIAVVTGPDPAYRATCAFLVEAALTIIAERDKIPSGGVLTPASAFCNTKYIDRLAKHGIKFEILKNTNKKC